MRFVNSLGLGKEPSIEPVRRRIARSPGVRFKLDAEATWAPALVDEVAATGAVDTIDFKGQYGLEVEDPEALPALYDRVLAAFPDAYLEDPHDLPGIAERLGDHLERVSYDAPIRSAEDIGATPLAARVVNVKPSRIGSLRRLFEVYARCARERRPMYGGGMGELGVGRGQIELLAALFHPDAPNDVAPSAYNEDDPAGDCPPAPWRRAPRRPASAGRRRRVPRARDGCWIDHGRSKPRMAARLYVSALLCAIVAAGAASTGHSALSPQKVAWKRFNMWTVAVAVYREDQGTYVGMTKAKLAKWDYGILPYPVRIGWADEDPVLPGDDCLRTRLPSCGPDGFHDEPEDRGSRRQVSGPLDLA